MLSTTHKMWKMSAKHEKLAYASMAQLKSFKNLKMESEKMMVARNKLQNRSQLKFMNGSWQSK